MSKKIFASGYFSMDKVVQQLVDDGHEVHTSYESSVKGTHFFDFGFDTLAEGTDEYNSYVKLADFIIKNMTVGGREIVFTDYAVHSAATWILSGAWRRLYVLEALKEHEDFDAVIVHNDYDPLYGTVVRWAQKRGIPAFCLYNGFSSNLHPAQTGMRDFRMGSYYCINGQLVSDYISEREAVMAEGVLTGCTAFDCLYGNDIEILPNTFLYNIATNYQEAEDAKAMYAHPVAIHPWTFSYRPAKTDDIFFRGFAKYKKEVNPDAKLVITLRPYHLMNYGKEFMKSEYGLEDVEVYTSHDRPFRTLIQECEYFISGISTTIQEAIVTRTPTVFLCGTEPAQDFFRGRGICYIESLIKPDTIAEALDVMVENKEMLIAGCNERADFYNYKDDGRASERTVAYIYDVMDRS
jgi:hypothetical protein